MSRTIDADALEVVTAKVPKGMDAKSYMAGMEYVLSQIDALPTIEERKTGKWIIEPYDAQNDIFIHRCGTCMRVAMLDDHTTKFKFCPLCGSAMEGEQP